MKETITEYIANLEREENIRVLLAAESGSRSWGFPSADSDYDVRIIYVHAPEWYFAVSKTRDTIEYMSDDRQFDLSGWDLRKALVLMSRTNPSFSDWLFSDVIYLENKEFVNDLRELHDFYYNPLRAAHHYASLARNFKSYVTAGDEVNPKKLLYFLRAILNTEYIIEHEAHPPVNFISTVDSLHVGKDIRLIIDKLILTKRAFREKDLAAVDSRLLEFALLHYDDVMGKMEDFHSEWRFPSCGLSPLDQFVTAYITG